MLNHRKCDAWLNGLVIILKKDYERVLWCLKVRDRKWEAHEHGGGIATIKLHVVLLTLNTVYLFIYLCKFK